MSWTLPTIGDSVGKQIISFPKRQIQLLSNLHYYLWRAELLHFFVTQYKGDFVTFLYDTFESFVEHPRQIRTHDDCHPCRIRKERILLVLSQDFVVIIIIGLNATCLEKYFVLSISMFHVIASVYNKKNIYGSAEIS